MDLYTAAQFSAKRIADELFSAGSIFSVYSLASTFAVAACALAWRQKRRRGHTNLRALSRAIFTPKLLLRESVIGDFELFILSVVLTPVIMGSLVISLNSVAVATRSLLTSALGPLNGVACCDLTIKIASTLILFLAYEIGYYFDHYIKHRISFLWELHKLHHTADVLTPLTNFRNHPIDSLVFGYNLAFFIGGATGVLDWLLNRKTEIFAVDGKNILFLVFLWTIGHLQHSQFWIPFRGVWGYLVLSPAHHQIHHSDDPKHFNRNLGSVLAVWDWMFGTLEIPTTKNPRLTYGVDEAGVNRHSVSGMLVTPAVKSATALWRALLSISTTLASAWNALSPKRSGV